MAKFKPKGTFIRNFTKPTANLPKVGESLYPDPAKAAARKARRARHKEIMKDYEAHPLPETDITSKLVEILDSKRPITRSMKEVQADPPHMSLDKILDKANTIVSKKFPEGKPLTKKNYSLWVQKGLIPSNQKKRTYPSSLIDELVSIRELQYQGFMIDEILARKRGEVPSMLLGRRAHTKKQKELLADMEKTIAAHKAADPKAMLMPPKSGSLRFGGPNWGWERTSPMAGEERLTDPVGKPRGTSSKKRIEDFKKFLESERRRLKKLGFSNDQIILKLKELLGQYGMGVSGARRLERTYLFPFEKDRPKRSKK